MTELYRSKLGEVGDRAYWEIELDKFWKCFRGGNSCWELERLPKRPKNAWDRFVKVVGLEPLQQE